MRKTFKILFYLILFGYVLSLLEDSPPKPEPYIYSGHVVEYDWANDRPIYGTKDSIQDSILWVEEEGNFDDASGNLESLIIELIQPQPRRFYLHYV